MRDELNRPDPPDRPPDVSGGGARPLPPPAGRPEIEGYEIRERLGEGGMGTVWRAVQKSTHREVALKLMSESRLGSQKVRQRFEREVELAARLEHPNIARVYDSGIDQGVYYYAMECIEGVPLDNYVGSRKLPRREILRLMQKVCEAVQHAHRNGVIHRDLKFSNIMVTADGEPHVLDFGLAKPMEQAGPSVSLSMDGDVLGTPWFMSPEQAGGKAREADTRADVYSLGVMLYRLLTGIFPHDIQGTAWEVMKRVAEEEPKRPRAVDKTMDADLEALLLKALQREPEQRYETSGHLARDIANYLAGDPLMAQPATTLYFLRKRIRKHRLPLALATAIMAVLLGLGAFSLVRIRRERNLAVQAGREAELQRDRAEENFRTARRTVQDLLVRLGAGGLDNVPGVIPLRIALFRQADQYYESFIASNADDPLLRLERARLLGELARQYALAADTASALSAASNAVAQLEQVEAAHPDSRDLLFSLAGACETLAEQLYEQGENPAAFAAMQKAVKIIEKMSAVSPEDSTLLQRLGVQYGLLAQWHSEQFDARQAKHWGGKSLEMQERAAQRSPGERRALAMTYVQQAKRLLDSGDIEQARNNARKAMALATKMNEANPNDTAAQRVLAASYSTMAKVNLAEGQLAEAEDLYGRSSALADALLKADPQNIRNRRMMAFELGQLGVTHAKRGNWPKAEEALRRAQNEFIRPLVETDPSSSENARMLVWNRLHMAEVLREQKKYDEAESEMTHNIESLRLQASGNPRDLFNLARSYADRAWTRQLAGLNTPDQNAAYSNDVRLALATLENAVEHGFRDRAELLDGSPISLLQDQPAFQQILARLSESGERAETPKPPQAEQEPFSGVDASGQSESAAVVLDAGDEDGVREHMNQYVVITGTVEKVVVTPGNAPLEIRFKRRGAARAVSGMVFKRNRQAMDEAFGGDFAATLAGRAVRITGKPGLYEGTLQIIIEWPGQIQLMSPAPGSAGQSEVRPGTYAADRTDALIAAAGTRVTVQGTVESAKWSRGGRVLYVNFSGAPRDGFYAVIHTNDVNRLAAAWGGDSANMLPGKEVRISGPIEMFYNKPQIVIRQADQVEILE